MKQTDKQAVALSYHAMSDIAPKVKAKGKGYIAEKILENAKEHDVPVQEDPSLLEVLSQLELNDTIPEELYDVVSELLAFVYRLDRYASDQQKLMTND